MAGFNSIGWRLILLVCGAVVLLSVGTVWGANPRPQQSRTSCKVVTLMPAFWSFRDRAKGADDARQLSLFKSIVIEPYREVFQAAMIGNEGCSVARQEVSARTTGSPQWD